MEQWLLYLRMIDFEDVQSEEDIISMNWGGVELDRHDELLRD